MFLYPMLGKAKEITWLVSKDFVASRSSRMEKNVRRSFRGSDMDTSEKNKPQGVKVFWFPQESIASACVFVLGKDGDCFSIV